MGTFFTHLLDILVGTLVLRMVLGWLITYPRLLRLLIMLVALVSLAFVVRWAQLPFSGIVFWILLAPISLVVLLSFLPEMGKIYQSASRGNLFGNVRNRSENSIPALAETLLELSRLKHGALLVFPSSKDAEGLIQGGEEVDAHFNTSLLLSIFNPECPRHDGAVVIINDRIRRIGAFLPLASAEGTESQMGTRHLAALGLTQRSDAHVLVVSEERQVISHTHDGKLQILSSHNPEQLKSVLQDVLGKNNNQNLTRRHAWVTACLWLVCLSVAATGSLKIDAWKAWMLESSSVLTYVSAGVEQLPAAKGFFVEDLRPREITLSMRASQLFKPIGGLRILVVPKETRPGRYTLNLSEADVVGLPRDVRIERFEPASIQYTVAEIRKIKIVLERPDLSGLSGLFKVAASRLEPESIQADVQDTKWKSSTLVKPSTVDLGSINKTGEHRIPVNLNLPPTIKPVEGENPQVFLVLEIKNK